MSELTEDEIRENLQVVSITVNFGVADVRRLRPDWDDEQCEHFIDSVYRELSAEAHEAGIAFMERVMFQLEGQDGAEN